VIGMLALFWSEEINSLNLWSAGGMLSLLLVKIRRRCCTWTLCH